jgi:hypothetical protein
MSNKLYEPDSIDYAVRRSMTGEAGRVVMHLGPTASIPEILYKLDSIYGDVEKKVDLLETLHVCNIECKQTLQIL